MNKLPAIKKKRSFSIQLPKHSKSETDDNKLSRMNNFDIAIDYYTKGILNDKKNITFLIKRATCYLAKGYYNLALKDALKTIAINPNFDKGYYIASLSYLEMYDIDKAEELSKEKNQRLKSLITKRKKELKQKCEQYQLYSKYIFFLKELYKFNSFFPKLEIHFFSDNYRGVIAKSDIKKYEIIMSIPKICLISMDIALSTKIGKEIGKFMYQELHSPRHSLFSSFLLSEKQSEKWKFYFDLLPKDFSYFPIFYTDNELEYLRGSPFLSQIFEKRIEMKSDYDVICNYIPSFSSFPFIKFCQARMSVSSRIFGVTMNGVRADVLVPFADLINHRTQRQTQWYYDNAQNSFMIQSLEDIKEGNEIYDSYGKKSNAKLLLNYGFCLENNSENEYYLTLKFNPKVPLFSQKKVIFQREEDYERTFKLYSNVYESELYELLSFLRFLIFEGDFNVLMTAMNNKDDENMNDTSPVSFYYIEPISKELEIKVLKHLNSILREALRRYPTSLDEDKKMLKNKNISFNQRNCLLLIISEKILLIYYIYFCEYCLTLFTLTEREIITKVSNDYKYNNCQFSFYIQEVILKLIQL